jgi:hypothetical protein
MASSSRSSRPPAGPGPDPDAETGSGSGLGSAAGSDSESASGAAELITDPVVLRAAAHPTRVKLLGMIGVNGTLTASRAAQELGTTAAVTAYHLRTLGKYGFVEDAGGGSARERPWRLTARGASFSWDAQGPLGRVMTQVAHAEWIDHVRRYREQAGDYPQDVRDASTATEMVLHATPAEVMRLTARIEELLEPFRSRVEPARRPAGTVPMEILVFTHPLPPEFRALD